MDGHHESHRTARKAASERDAVPGAVPLPGCREAHYREPAKPRPRRRAPSVPSVECISGLALTVGAAFAVSLWIALLAGHTHGASGPGRRRHGQHASIRLALSDRFVLFLLRRGGGLRRGQHADHPRRQVADHVCRCEGSKDLPSGFQARGQVTAMLAPPAGALPTSQRPLVARTTASAIARPSPAPPGWSLALRNRSNIQSRCSGAIPGPESSTTSLTWWPSAVTRTSTEPCSGVYLQALSRSTPRRWSSHSGDAAITCESPV